MVPETPGVAHASPTSGPSEMPPPRRDRVLPYVVVAIGLAVLGLAGALWRPTTPAGADVATALDDFPTGLLQTVERYFLPRFLLATVEPVLLTVLAGAILLSRAGRRALEALAGAHVHSPRRAGYVAAAVTASVMLVVFPVHLAVRWLRPGSEPTDGASLAVWGAEWFAERMAVVGLIALAAALLAAMLPRWPRSWPWRLTIAATALMAVVAFVNPWVIDPLVVDRQPLPPGEMRATLEEVLHRAGHPDMALKLGTGQSVSELGAYVSGVGRSREIVLAQTVMVFAPRETAFIAAHELAHHEHHDVTRGVLLTATVLLPALLLLRLAIRSGRVRALVAAHGPSDPRLFAAAVVFALAVNAVAVPLVNLSERRTEMDADWRALQITEDPAAGVSILRFLVEEIGVHPDPPGWYQALRAVHPAIADRIRLAAAFAEQEDIDLHQAETRRGRS